MSVVLIAGIALVFVGALLMLVAAGVFNKQAVGVNRSLQVLEAMTAAPDQLRSTEVDQPFGQRVLDPALEKLVGLGKRFSGADSYERTKNKIEQAGSPAGLTPDKIAAYKLVGFAVAVTAAVLGCLIFGVPVAPTLGIVVLAAVLGFQTPSLYLYQKAYDRHIALRKSLADALDLLTISVESGLAFDAAVAHVAKSTKGPLSEEFSRVLQEMQIGRSRSEALRSFSERCQIPEIQAFVTAMVQADAFGIPIAQVLRVQSKEMRIKRRQIAEEQAQKVPVKILFPLIFFILPCLFVVVLGPAVLNIMDTF